MASLEFGSNIDGTGSFLSPYWPVVVAHRIDKDSPLYTMSARDVSIGQFELIVTLEGTTPDTSSTVQVRTSYLPSEILWGHRFEHSTVSYDPDTAKYSVSFKTLNNTIPDRTPRLVTSCLVGLIWHHLISRQSAQELEEKKEDVWTPSHGFLSRFFYEYSLIFTYEFIFIHAIFFFPFIHIYYIQFSELISHFMRKFSFRSVIHVKVIFFMVDIVCTRCMTNILSVGILKLLCSFFHLLKVLKKNSSMTM